MKINPGLTIVALDPQTIQIGSGVRAIHIQHATPAIRRFLDALSTPTGIPDGKEIDIGAQCGLSSPAVWKFLNLIDAVLVSSHQPTDEADSSEPADPAWGVELAQSIASLHAVTPSDTTLSGAGAGAVLPRRLADIRTQRADTAIQILGAGRTGQVIAEQLLRGGIGQLWLWDPGTVTSGEPLALRDPASVGRHRAVAVAEYLKATQLPEESPVGIFPQTHPDAPLPTGDLTVVIGLGGIPLETWVSLNAAEQVCIPVVMMDDQALIGPWLVPGVAPCPGCWEQANAVEDPLRSRRVEALAAMRAGAESMPVASVVAGLVTLQIFNWLDAALLRATIPQSSTGVIPGGVVPGQMIRLSTATGAMHTFVVDSHPDCCGAPSDTWPRAVAG